MPARTSGGENAIGESERSCCEPVESRPNRAKIVAALQCGRPGCVCAKGKQVHCPAHDDEHPSLSVDEREGRILVHCFAGCSQDAVIEGLRRRGAWDAPLPVFGPSVPQTQDVLFGVVRFITQYVVLPSQAAVIAVALWVLHTWTLAAFDVTVYLVVKSPTMRAGKTRLFEVMECLLPTPWRVIGPSEAVLFRKI